MPTTSSHTEKPTAQRLEKARKEGQFVSSREMVAAFQFLALVAFASAWFPGWLREMRGMLRSSLAAAFRSSFDVESLPSLMGELLRRAFVPVVVIGAVAALATLVSHLVITRLGFSLKKLTLDFKRFNPAPKIRNMVRQGPASVLQAAAMLVLFTAVIVAVARDNTNLFFTLPFTTLDVGMRMVGTSLKTILWKAAGLFLVFGGIDLFRQQQRFTKDLLMTKHEVKEEQKEAVGNPHVKGKIRRLQRDYARRRMLRDVATAAAVIVNPSHYAVALRYEHATMATPVVVAKGRNHLALRIRQRALDTGVPLVENPPLAQGLYKSVNVGEEIPAHLYRAVAEVLGYIYRMSQSRR